METTFTADVKGKYLIQMCRQDLVFDDNRQAIFIDYDDFVPASSIEVYVGMSGPGSKKDISGATISGVSNKVYTGDSITQSPTVKLGGKTLVNGTDYYVTYKSTTYSGGTNIVDTGTVEMTVHGKGGYTGTVSKSFRITPKQLTEDMVKLTPSSLIYNGELQKPQVTVMYGSVRLADAVDYTLNNEGGTEAGKYLVSVTARSNNYTGSVTKKYVIGSWDAAAAEVLTDKIMEVRGVLGQYLDADRSALQTALNEAEQLFASPETTTAQMNQAVKKLNTLKTAAEKNLAKRKAEEKAAKQLPSAKDTEKNILAQKTDKDPAGSAFTPLKLRSTKQGKNSNTLTWQKVSGAASYVIYGNKCGKNNRIKKLATVKGTTYTHKKLKKGTYYKYVVVAVKNTVIGNRTAATSKMIHAATKGGKVTNHKAVKMQVKVGKKWKSATALTVKTGKTKTVRGVGVKLAKKLSYKAHVKMRYASSKTAIATVTAKGVITGKKKGSCYITAYSQNGVYKSVKVTVK